MIGKLKGQNFRGQIMMNRIISLDRYRCDMIARKLEKAGYFTETIEKKPSTAPKNSSAFDDMSLSYEIHIIGIYCEHEGD